jgi:hypothetical protein
MLIRAQLIILVLALVAPVAVWAAMTTLGLWDLQRDAYQQRFLERVSPLRIALDTELDNSLRQWRDLSESVEFDGSSQVAGFGGYAERLLVNHPAWSMLGVVAADGRVVVRADRRPELAAARFDASLVEEVKASSQGRISNPVDVPAAPGTFVTYLAMPIVREGTVLGAIYIRIESAAWFDFLRRYSIDERATLTLNDREGRIVTRTLHSEKWAGRRSTEAYLSQTV